MIFTIVGILAVLLLGVVGWMRGALRILSAFAALVVSGLLARPLGFLTAWAFQVFHWLPLTLAPLGGIVTTGLLLFIALESVGAHYVKRRETARKVVELPARADWESWGGAVLGCVWGVCVVTLILTGLDLIATADLAVANASLPHETKPQAQWSNPYDRPLPTPEPTPSYDESDKKLDVMQRDLQESVFGGIVHAVSPLDDAGKQALRDLAQVVNDPVLFDRFQQQPAVQELAKDPKLIAVSQDRKIQLYMHNQDFPKLLDDPKIADLLNDPEIYRKCRDLNIAAVLQQVKQGLATPPPPP